MKTIKNMTEAERIEYKAFREGKKAARKSTELKSKKTESVGRYQRGYTKSI